MRTIGMTAIGVIALLAGSPATAQEAYPVPASQQRAQATLFAPADPRLLAVPGRPETRSLTVAMPFEETAFAQFMASPAGRLTRIIAGAGLVAWGASEDGSTGTALVAAGAVPLSAGIFDFCVLSPLFGGPFWGRDIRATGRQTR